MERFDRKSATAKALRGLKKPETPIIPGCQICQNYLMPHEALDGETQAQAVA